MGLSDELEGLVRSVPDGGRHPNYNDVLRPLVRTARQAERRSGLRALRMRLGAMAGRLETTAILGSQRGKRRAAGAAMVCRQAMRCDRRPWAAAWVVGTLALGGCGWFSSGPSRQVRLPEPAAAPAAVRVAVSEAEPTTEVSSAVQRASFEQPVPMVLPNGARLLRPFPQWSEQEAAAEALGRIGAAAVPELIVALRSEDAAVRLKAVEVLGRMGPEAAAAVDDLVRLLDDPDARVRKAAIRTLGQIGPAAKEAVPALMQRLLAPADDS